MKKFFCFLCLFILLLPNNISHAQLVEKTKDNEFKINENIISESEEVIPPSNVENNVESNIELSHTYTVIYIGTSFELRLNNVPHKEKIVYIIDGCSVYKSSKGVTITGVQEGVSICKAYYNNKEYTCTIVVKDPNKITDYTYLHSYEITDKIYSLYSEYPEGMKWDNTCRYIWSPNSIKANSTSEHYIYDGGGACASLCMLFSDLIFPNQPIYYFNDINDIQIGDILCVDNGHHMVMVVEMNETQISVVEGNFNKSIHWRRLLNKADMGFKFGYSRIHQ